MRENNERCCENCKWFEVQGGDWVDYGSTRTQLPEEYVCTNDVTDLMTDYDYAKWNTEHIIEGSDCPHWQDKNYKERGEE